MAKQLKPEKGLRVTWSKPQLGSLTGLIKAALLLVVAVGLLIYTCPLGVSLDLKVMHKQRIEFNSIGRLSPVLKTWSYSHKYDTWSKLKIRPSDMSPGLEFNGSHTHLGIMKMVEKAFRGIDSHVVVMGGSASQGADIGVNNTKLVFHAVFVDWWNEVIGKATGTRLHVRSIAIGAVPTDYFSFCWREYLSENQTIDLVIWEFAINDHYNEIYSEVLERLIRSVLNYQTSPTLLFASFLYRTSFAGVVMKAKSNECRKKERIRRILLNLAMHYKLTSLSWEGVLCNYFKAKDSDPLPEEYYIRHHPKRIGHAHLSYLLIDYAHTITFKDMTPHNQAVSSPPLPDPYYDEVKQSEYTLIRCYSNLTPDFRRSHEHYLSDLSIAIKGNYEEIIPEKWNKPEERYDYTAGFLTHGNHSSLTIEFNHNLQTWNGNVYIVYRTHPSSGHVTVTCGSQVTEFDAKLETEETVGVFVKKVSNNHNVVTSINVETENGGIQLCGVIFAKDRNRTISNSISP